MSDVTYSRPWTSYALLSMLVSIPSIVVLVALSVRFHLIEGPALGLLTLVLWISPAWAFVPLLVTLNGRAPIERDRVPLYSERRRQGRLALYVDILVVRLWEGAGVRTEVIPLEEIEHVQTPLQTWPMVCYGAKIGLFDGRKRRKIVWYTSTPHRLADAVQRAKTQPAVTTAPQRAVPNLCDALPLPEPLPIADG